jgi:hypothetical protein
MKGCGSHLRLEGEDLGGGVAAVLEEVVGELLLVLLL